MKILAVKKAWYISERAVDLDISTDTLGDIPITVLLDDDDQTPHIVELKQWIAGNPLEVAAFVPPTNAEKLATQYKEQKHFFKTACREHIQKTYSAEEQLDAALDISGDKVKIVNFIVACRTEQSRVDGLLAAAGTVDELNLVNAAWPTP